MKPLQSFIFIGRSGSGKGTQAQLLVDHIQKQDPQRKVLYVQTGAEFRNFMKQGANYTQERSKKIFETGGLVPEFLAVYLWSQRIVNDFTAEEHLVMDGMPRKYHEAVVLDSLFDFYGLQKPKVIYLNVGDAWARGRLMERHRLDDTRQEIDKRLSWFTTEVLPTIEYYRNNKAYTVYEIDGERSIAEIHADIRSRILL